MSVVIDEEFRALIPPLQADERQQLENNLARDGCLQPLIVWRNGKDVLLDGHNRLDICRKLGLSFKTAPVEVIDRDDAKIWIIRNQFGRRNLALFTRAELVLRLEPLLAAKARERMMAGKSDPMQNSAQGTTREELAKIAGMSHDTIAKAKAVSEKASETVKAKLRSGETSINAAYKKLKKSEQKAEKAKAKATVPSNLPVATERYRLIVGDVSSLPEVADESVDWIVTDPPYPKDFLGVYEPLSFFASRILKPGGGLLVMVGQSYLPDVIASLCKHMKYQWTLAYLTPGPLTELWDRRVNTAWKPILWFVKGKYDGAWISDVTKSEAPDKHFHGWGQSESGMADILERFTYPGQTICDPFCGGGSTGAVALKMNRLFIGSDIDPAAIEATKQRLAELTL